MDIVDTRSFGRRIVVSMGEYCLSVRLCSCMTRDQPWLDGLLRLIAMVSLALAFEYLQRSAMSQVSTSYSSPITLTTQSKGDIPQSASSQEQRGLCQIVTAGALTLCRAAWLGWPLCALWMSRYETAAAASSGTASIVSDMARGGWRYDEPPAI